MAASAGPVRLRPTNVELLGMQFDGTDMSALAIGSWLERETRIIYGMLFSVMPDTSPKSLSLHGARGCWVLRRHDGTFLTETDEWVNKRYEHVPMPDAEAFDLTLRIVAHWQASRHDSDHFTITSEEELFGCLLSVFTTRPEPG